MKKKSNLYKIMYKEKLITIKNIYNLNLSALRKLKNKVQRKNLEVKEMI